MSEFIDLEIFFVDGISGYTIADVNKMIFLDFMLYLDRFVAKRTEEQERLQKAQEAGSGNKKRIMVS
jgi:hypothetical protein